ncbi:MAG TPA: DUF6152 family protein [Caulobacteraceae bacterium]|nr:DUF6152 family protein [Caulobacteraceae bacterium]
MAVALTASAPAFAHHSFNMFALDKVVTVDGTIKDYQFKMPHVWFYVVTMTKGGAQEEWGFEAHSPNLVARKGWTVNSLKPGDKIAVTMHPMKDGSKAGSVVYVTYPNGKVLWNAQSLNEP